MSNLCVNLIRALPKRTIITGTKESNIKTSTLKYTPADVKEVFKKTYSELSGLRSMQHIKGPEREIIEAYRKELPHEIWGDSEKMKEWALNKFNELRNKNYKSFMLDEHIIERERNKVVKYWAELLDNNIDCNKNPFLKLKILRSVVEDLSEKNMQLAPIINQKILSDAVRETKKTGASFKKVYYKLIREFDSSLNVKTEEVCENGVRGKWFSLRVPDWAEADRSPGLFNKIKDFVSVLSQGSNWCIRTPRTVGREFSGCDFHIFIDKNGLPQLCIAGTNEHGGWFRYVRGNDQYVPIKNEYKSVLKSYLERHNLDDAIVGRNESDAKHILDICE